MRDWPNSSSLPYNSCNIVWKGKSSMVISHPECGSKNESRISSEYLCKNKNERAPSIQINNANVGGRRRRDHI